LAAGARYGKRENAAREKERESGECGVERCIRREKYELYSV